MSTTVSAGLLPPFLAQGGKVVYSDGDVHGSLYWLNFCRHCKQLRDRKGMQEEIEVLRCSSCSETFTHTETNEKEHGCPQCFECPVCSQALIVRTTFVNNGDVSTENEPSDGKTTQEKKFHLVCRTCRWSSRTAGVPDASKQSSVVSPWNFKPDASTRDEVTALADFYRGLSVTDRASMVPKNQKPKKYRPGYPFIADKYKLVSVAQKRVSAAAVAPPDMVVLQAKLPKVQHLNNLAECSEEELLRSVSVNEAQNRLTLDKRLMYPGEQPLTADKLLPRNKPLVCKKLSRCKACQHVMTKMDFAAPHTVKFKINSSASLLVPTVKPCKPLLTLGKPSHFVVIVKNPFVNDIQMSFSLPPEDEAIPGWINGAVVRDVVLPSKPVVLLSRLCVADEKMGEGSPVLSNEDASSIAFKKLYTVGLKFSCTPVSKEEDNWVSFMVNYDYQEVQNTLFSSASGTDLSSSGSGEMKPKEPQIQTTWIILRVDMNLGKAV